MPGSAASSRCWRAGRRSDGAGTGALRRHASADRRGSSGRSVSAGLPECRRLSAGMTVRPRSSDLGLTVRRGIVPASLWFMPATWPSAAGSRRAGFAAAVHAGLVVAAHRLAALSPNRSRSRCSKVDDRMVAVLGEGHFDRGLELGIVGPFAVAAARRCSTRSAPSPGDAPCPRSSRCRPRRSRTSGRPARGSMTHVPLARDGERGCATSATSRPWRRRCRTPSAGWP